MRQEAASVVFISLKRFFGYIYRDLKENIEQRCTIIVNSNWWANRTEPCGCRQLSPCFRAMCHGNRMEHALWTYMSMSLYPMYLIALPLTYNVPEVVCVYVPLRTWSISGRPNYADWTSTPRTNVTILANTIKYLSPLCLI